MNTNDTRLLLNTQRVREFEPRRLRLSFFFVCRCFFFVIVLFRVVVECCVVRILGGDGKAFGEKIIILRIKTHHRFLQCSLSLSFSPTTTTTSEREKEREGRDRFILLSWRWWIKIKGRWSPRTTTKKQRRLHPHHHRMLFIITIMVSNNNKTIILRRCDRKP